MRFIIYNYSNWTYLEEIVHNDTDMVNEVLDDCMIVLTSDIIYALYKLWLKIGGIVILNLRFLSYIIEE